MVDLSALTPAPDSPYRGMYKRFEDFIVSAHKDYAATPKKIAAELRHAYGGGVDTPSQQVVRYILKRNGLVALKKTPPQKPRITVRSLAIWRADASGVPIKLIAQSHHISQRDARSTAEWVGCLLGDRNA